MAAESAKADQASCREADQCRSRRFRDDQIGADGWDFPRAAAERADDEDIVDRVIFEFAHWRVRKTARAEL